MTPLWFASVATVPAGAFAAAWEPRAGWLGRASVRPALVALLLVPAVACAAIAITSGAPLHMQVLAATAIGDSPSVRAIEVRVTNIGPVVLRPHFAVSSGEGMSPYWNRVTGPEALDPGQTAEYRLTTTGAGVLPGPRDYFLLRAVTDDPMTISSAPIPKAAANPTATPTPSNSQSAATPSP